MIFTFGSGGVRDGQGDNRLIKHHRNIFIRYAINAKGYSAKLRYLAVAFEDKPKEPELPPKTNSFPD